jgi:myo-inositol-1(or 4)-monophosphatase
MKRFLISHARKAGKMAMAYRKNLSSLTVDKKSEKDLVTEADRAIEEYLRRAVHGKFPGHTIIGEEEGVTSGNEHVWIIDPIDGTVSFAHGQVFFSISIAYQFRGKLIYGAVYAPALDEFYFAEKGKGAFCNGKPVHVSKRETLLNSVLATGFACLRSNIPVEKSNIPRFTALVPKIRSVRRYGSAAYDLALTAAGKLEGFWEMNLNIYDVAAGILLVREAGGTVTDFSGGQNGIPAEIAASNGLIHGELLSYLKD